MDNFQKQTKPTEQKVVLTNRSKIEIGGVVEVVSAQDNVIALKTDLGAMQVLGSGLRIDMLSLENKQLVIDGNINGIKYDTQINKKNFFARLFK